MKSSAGTGAIVLLPVPAHGSAGTRVRERPARPGRSPEGLGSGPVLFLTMTGGDLYIRGDGASCLYIRKDRDDPDAV